MGESSLGMLQPGLDLTEGTITNLCTSQIRNNELKCKWLYWITSLTDIDDSSPTFSPKLPVLK